LIFTKKMSIDYLKSVTAVTRLVDIPEFLLVTTKGFSAKSVPELIDITKKNPGKVRYGTVGAGSYPHFDMAYFDKKAGDLDMIAIHNKAGASGVINDMLSGDTQVSFLNVASSAPMVKAGELKPLALVNDKRLPEYPDVPTMQEVGFPGVGTLAWQAMFAPAGTPKPILETVHKAVLQAMQAPAVVEAFNKQNFRIVPNATVDEAKIWLADEMKNWKTITDTVQIEVTE
jgi:tripartite-type tricarboxylate transporter receptor subunit TctC